jgi:hypothetical protein
LTIGTKSAVATIATTGSTIKGATIATIGSTMVEATMTGAIIEVTTIAGATIDTLTWNIGPV